MSRILVLFAHPALERSELNVHLADVARAVAGVTLHDLYETYPDFDIDVAREKALLVEHDAIVLQHPLYWYSTPAIVKQWEDLVLEYGWAYGEHGRALENKMMMSAVSTGSPESAYRREGFHGHTIPEFLAPIRRTAELCRMRVLPPFITYGAHAMNAADVERAKTDYRRVLEALASDRLDPDALGSHARINADLDAILKKEPTHAR